MSQTATSYTLSHARGHLVVALQRDLASTSTISEILELVSSSVAKGTNRIAIRFTRASFFSSDTIAVIVKAHETLQLAGGQLAIVDPNVELMGVLVALGLEKVLCICRSEDELPLPDTAQS